MGFDEFVDRLRLVLTADVPTSVTPYDGLYDELGFDSFQAFELMIVIESMAGDAVPPEDVPQLFTLGDAYEYFRAMRAAAEAAQK